MVEAQTEIDQLRAEVETQKRKIVSLMVKLEYHQSIIEEVISSLESSLIANTDQATNKIKTAIQKLTELSPQERNWDQFMFHFEKIHPDFFKLLLMLDVKLSSNELKHCAYIKLKLTKKQIAEILGIAHRSVEMAHYRIKKKLELPKKISLRNYVVSLGLKNDSDETDDGEQRT